MAIKLPIVFSNGKFQQLQTNDTIIGQSIVSLVDASSITVDLTKSAKFVLASIGGNRTITFSGDIDGSQFWIDITQDSTGSRTITWPAGIKWMSGATGTPLATPSKTTIFAFTRIGSNNYRGFQSNES